MVAPVAVSGSVELQAPHPSRATRIVGPVFLALAALFILLAITTAVSALDDIRQEMRRGNDLTCIELRESGADASSATDNEVCP